jgi:hypothetical protein
MQEDAQDRGVRRRVALRQERADHAGQHVPGTAGGEAGIAGEVDPDAAVWGAAVTVRAPLQGRRLHR